MTTYATSTAVTREALIDRVVVDNVDITWFRGKHTPVPPYQLQEPFGYGPSRLPLPQINGCYEQMGVGELSWARRGARVLYQRVDSTGAVIHTDYRGRLLDRVIDGESVVWNVGGDISGPASNINEQPPRFRKMRDIGRWVWNACNDLGINLEPYAGPVTGVEVPDRGHMTLLARLEELGALSQNADGNQRALMPVVWGGGDYAFDHKNRTNVDLTIYNDATRAVLKVADAASEAPNTYFGTGITPDGVRIFNGRYPGLQQGDPPPYPMAGGASFGVGTTDAATLTGEGITVLYSKLVTIGYLQAFDFAGVYTATMADAVTELQNDAGLAETGIVNVATWNALYDLDVTGYSFLDSRIFPMAIRPEVRAWNYTATGNYLDRNEFYDPTVLRVDRNIDFGPGMTKSQMVSWCHGQMRRAQSSKNWVGSIRLNQSGAFIGNHDGADAATLTDADLMPYRDIRPGMNARLPLFDGDTLFHISGVDVDSDGATLWVDTQARDLMEVKAIIDRNRESSRDIRREWFASNRGGKPTGNMVTRDEFFGHLFNDITLPSGWTVEPIIMGQQGQVNRTHLQLAAGREFAVAVFSRPVTPKQLQNRIGNPLATLGSDDVPWYEDAGKLGDWFERRTLLYSAGTGEQPCGYWPRKHTNNAGLTTSAPLTGEWYDDASWPYICGPEEQVVCYLAVYNGGATTTLERGQVFWAQEDDVI